MRLIRVILYLLLGIIGVSFAALNATNVQVNFYLTQLTIPISLLMVLMLGLGLIIGFLILIPKYWQLKLSFLKTKNLLRVTEKDLNNLRDIPVKDHH